MLCVMSTTVFIKNSKIMIICGITKIKFVLDIFERKKINICEDVISVPDDIILLNITTYRNNLWNPTVLQNSIYNL